MQLEHSPSLLHVQEAALRRLGTDAAAVPLLTGWLHVQGQHEDAQEGLEHRGCPHQLPGGHTGYHDTPLDGCEAIGAQALLDLLSTCLPEGALSSACVLLPPLVLSKPMACWQVHCRRWTVLS